MANWLGALDHLRAMGEIPFFYAPLTRKFPLVATRDIGLAGTKVLQEHWTGERVLEVDGPEGGTDLHETAAAYARLAGREVKAVQLPEAAWQNVLEALGMPADRTCRGRKLRAANPCDPRDRESGSANRETSSTAMD
jgi:uncharacterized protein YbjT (DUF2867 family)